MMSHEAELEIIYMKIILEGFCSAFNSNAKD